VGASESLTYGQAQAGDAAAELAPGRPPLYASVAYDESRRYLHVITLHWFDPRKWEDPWTRKPRPPKLNGEQKE